MPLLHSKKVSRERLARRLTYWLAAGSLLAAVIATRFFFSRHPASGVQADRATARAAVRGRCQGIERECRNRRADPEFHTFSICGIDPAAGQCGVAVTTRVTQVGRYVPWVRAGVGAVATQATTAVKFGREGLDLLTAGKTPTEAIEELLKDDINREHRQLGIIDMQGRTAAFTGQEDGVYAGSRQGKNYTVQGNLLVGREVIDAVADSFESTHSADRTLADRLIAALEAGQRAGGDKRKGRMQSASLVVADEHHSGVADDHIVETLQVAEHPEPVGELRRQYDCIHERLGHRTFAMVRGRDVVQLKQMLHRLKLLWPDRAEFPSRRGA